MSVVTVSEVLEAAAHGFFVLKLFPAEAVGGSEAPRLDPSPLPHFSFCLAGSISPGSAQSYLDLPNVAYVGDNWLTPASALRAGDWDRAEELTAEALKLSRTP